MSSDLLKKIESDSYNRLKRMFPELDFSAELAENPELAEYVRQACINVVNNVDEPLSKPDAPKLNEDFSKYFVINNLPKCDEARAKKLT